MKKSPLIRARPVEPTLPAHGSKVLRLADVVGEVVELHGLALNSCP